MLFSRACLGLGILQGLYIGKDWKTERVEEMFTITAERTGRLKIPIAKTNLKINVNSGRNVYHNC